MPMTEMRFTDEEKKDFHAPQLIADKPRFPHGLQVRLIPESLKKLGMINKEDLPQVGDKMVMLAKVEVVGVEKESPRDDIGDYEVRLQITDLGLEKNKQDKEIRSAGEVLYSAKDS